MTEAEIKNRLDEINITVFDDTISDITSAIKLVYKTDIHNHNGGANQSTLHVMVRYAIWINIKALGYGYSDIGAHFGYKAPTIQSGVCRGKQLLEINDEPFKKVYDKVTKIFKEF